MKPKNTARWKQKKRLAVSPVIATILLIAITITVGFAAWAWVRSAALSSELNFGKAIGTNITCLSENFVIPNANFSSTKTNLVTVWFYNNGNGTVYVSSLTISNTTWAYNAPTTTVIKTGLGNSSTYNVGTNFRVGSLYTFTGVARCQGDIKATYQQVR